MIKRAVLNTILIIFYAIIALIYWGFKKMEIPLSPILSDVHTVATLTSIFLIVLTPIVFNYVTVRFNFILNWMLFIVFTIGLMTQIIFMINVLRGLILRLNLLMNNQG